LSTSSSSSSSKSSGKERKEQALRDKKHETPASGVQMRRSKVSKPIDIPVATKAVEDLSKLSTEAVYNLRGATTGQFPIVFEPIDADEGELIINEDINLEDSDIEDPL
jgi:hypothetical protein